MVSTTNGELQLLHMPRTLNHLAMDDAVIPPMSLLKALLRVQSIITAMVAVPIPAPSACAPLGGSGVCVSCVDVCVCVCDVVFVVWVWV